MAKRVARPDFSEVARGSRCFSHCPANRGGRSVCGDSVRAGRAAWVAGEHAGIQCPGSRDTPVPQRASRGDPCGRGAQRHRLVHADAGRVRGSAVADRRQRRGGGNRVACRRRGGGGADRRGPGVRGAGCIHGTASQHRFSEAALRRFRCRVDRFGVADAGLCAGFGCRGLPQ